MKHIKGFFERNRVYALICISVWMCALVFGTYRAHMQDTDGFSGISEYTASVMDSNLKFGELFWNSIKIHFKYTMAFLICSSFVIGLPLSIFLIGFKGYCAGFAAVSLVRVCGSIKGSLISFLALVMPYCVMMPVIFMMYMLGLKYQMTRIKSGLNYSHTQKKKEWLSYAAAMLILFICLCLFSGIEAFLVPRLMRLFG